jgi:flagellar basal-body rod protein FlgF
MQDGLYVALSSQVALERRLNTIADNVANANTVGFRATGIKFSALVEGRGQHAMTYASTGDTYLSAQAGGLRQTSNPLDFAVRGDAWFSIDTPAGMVLTRDGRFTMLDTGELVSIEGHPVLDAGGAPIQLNPNGGAPTAGADGALRQDGALVGAIGLYSYAPSQDFRRFGNSGIVPLSPPEALVDRIDAGLVQGYVEDSNVNPVLEMTRLIMVQRAFENVSGAIRSTESSFTEAVRTLGGK